MGELRVGDEVFDDQGKPTRVVAVSPVLRDRPVWAVRTCDGDVIVADDAHEWAVRLCRKHRRIGPRETGWLARRTSPRNPKVEAAGALVLPDAELPIDPYTFGAWLGNGTSSSGAICAPGADGQHILGRIATAGYDIGTLVGNNSFTIFGLQVQLRALGVLGDKRIPAPYLRAARDQRLALLQGLIDTDGHVAPDGQVEFVSIRSELAGAVQELVRSLGVKAQLIEGRATLNGRDISAKYRVMFYMAGAASMPRKAERCRDAKKSGRYLTFESAGRADTVCVQVEAESHLFLAGRSMTPTCNSSLVSHYLPVWFLNTWPHKDVILTTYESGYAESWSRLVRETIVAHPELNVKLSKATSAARYWRTAQGGGMLATGAGGPITGRGGDLIIVDDPYKEAQDALSAHNREKVRNWYRSTLLTRQRSPQTLIFVIHTRWNENDLIGTLIEEEGDEWENIAIPAIAQENDPLGRAPGEGLWPERYSLEFYAEQRRSQGEFWFSAMYQAQPIPMGGSIFKGDWIKRYRQAEDGITKLTEHGEPGETIPWARLLKFSTVDLAISTKHSADWTVVTTFAVDHHTNLYVLDVQRIRLEGPDQPDLVRRVWRAWQPTVIGIERTGYQLSLVQLLLREGLPIRGFSPDSDKMARALPAAARYQSGMVWHPETAPWLPAFEGELLHFPKGSHDDQVDTVSHAVRLVSDGLKPSSDSSVEDRPTPDELPMRGNVRPGMAW